MGKTITVAVTGATGMIGYHVCKALISNGYRVKALVNTLPEYLEALPVEFIKGDVLDPESLKRLVGDADFVIHLAAKIALRKDKTGYTRQVNIEGVNHILQACLNAGVRRLVHFSSIHAYVPDLQKPFMDEQNQLATGSNILYEQTKSIAQQNVVDFCRKHPLEAIILNPTGVIGPEDYKPSNTCIALIDMWKGRLPFLPDGGFDWVDVRDVAATAVNALHHGTSGSSYILAGEFMKWKDIALLIRESGGTKISTRTLPLSFLKPVGTVMEMISDLTGTKPIFTREAILHLENAHPKVSCQKAKEELGFTNRPLTETIEGTFRWLKATGKIR